jgi:hypothetical protein
MPEIEYRVRELMHEAGATPMDLIRHGMAQGTAYHLSRNKISRIDNKTLALLCDFFTKRLGRRVNPGDIITCNWDE